MMMTNTPDELIESLVNATASGEVHWDNDSTGIRTALKATFGDVAELYHFLDGEAGAYVVVASYQYAFGEEGSQSTLDGTSLILVDHDDYEILNEVTDEDVSNPELFTKLIAAIKGN